MNLSWLAVNVRREVFLRMLHGFHEFLGLSGPNQLDILLKSQFKLQSVLECISK